MLKALHFQLEIQKIFPGEPTENGFEKPSFFKKPKKP